MASLKKIALLALGLTLISMVNAKNLPSPNRKGNIIQDLRMRMGVRTDGSTTAEEVELNYEQNYVRIKTPGRSGASPVVMIRDYNLNQTLYKANGRCFMLDVYNDFPSILADWTKMEDATIDGMIDTSGPENYKSHVYRQLQFPLNRTSFSPAIQEECPGDIMAVVLQETRFKQEAYDYVRGNIGNNDMILGEVFQPKTTSGHVRQKRDVTIIIGNCYIIIIQR